MGVILVNNTTRTAIETVPLKGRIDNLEKLMAVNDLFISVPTAILDTELNQNDFSLLDESIGKLLTAELPCTAIVGINLLWRRYGKGACDLKTKLALALIFPSALSTVIPNTSICKDLSHA